MGSLPTKISQYWDLEETSKELVEKIKNYWKNKGFTIKVWSEPFTSKYGYKLYQIRSNLKNGLPK